MYAVSISQGSPLVMNLDDDSLVQTERWTPQKHLRQGSHHWEPERLTPYLTELQKRGVSALSGRYLFNEIRNLPILNGNAICFLKRHQFLIPDCYRSLILLGWGTIYYERSTGREPFVRGLCWNGDAWDETDIYVNGFGFTARCAALMYAHPGITTHGRRAKL